MWGNLKTNYLINQKGQAILELATFGSVVLFCLALLIHFGLQMNYQQNVQMQAFRKALKLAYYKQGPNSQAGLMMMKDKPAVDPRDRWGFADRVSVGANASVTWSNTLNGVYVNEMPKDIDDVNPPVDDRDMPRMYIEVNKEAGGMGLADNEINDTFERDRVATQEKGVFRTGNWMWIGGVENLRYIGTYLENSERKLGPKDYFPLTVRPQDIKVFADPQNPQQKSAVFQYAGLKRTLINAVLISDEATENKFRYGTLSGAESRGVNIISVKGTYGNNCDTDNYCGTLTEILSIEPRLGEIDTYYVDVKPWDKDKALKNKQGLLMDSEKRLAHGSGTKIMTRETDKGISTRTESSATQTITHKIRLNNGTVVEVPVVFRPNQNYNYEVKYE